MKATGMVRRIDELGRVVIPKELRRTLRIKEGDVLEIFTEERGELILKKYSPVKLMITYAEDYAAALSNLSGATILICDTDTILFGAGKVSKDYFEKGLSVELLKFLKERKSSLLNLASGGKMILCKAEIDTVITAQVIVPIICKGDCLGAIIAISKDENVSFTNAELLVCKTAAVFIGKQLE